MIRKYFYPVSKYSSAKLLKSRLSEEVWKEIKSYFKNIIDGKAKDTADKIADNNKKTHEDNIRAENM